jgi:hypothetical protein
MIDDVRDIKDGAEAVIATYLGSSYKKLAYLNDVEKNNYNSNSNRYGVRALSANQVPGVTKYPTITQSFEVVLTKAYRESSLDDTEQLEKALDNFNDMLSIYRELVNSKCGVPNIVLNVNNISIAEPEYIVDSKVAVQRATIEITYRFSLI